MNENGAPVPSLFLIRPDGYGLVCQPVREQKLVDYLQRLFDVSARRNETAIVNV